MFYLEWVEEGEEGEADAEKMCTFECLPLNSRCFCCRMPASKRLDLEIQAILCIYQDKITTVLLDVVEPLSFHAFVAQLFSANNIHVPTS